MKFDIHVIVDFDSTSHLEYCPACLDGIPEDEGQVMNFEDLDDLSPVALEIAKHESISPTDV